MTITLKGDQITEEQRAQVAEMERQKQLIEDSLPTIQRIQAVRSTTHIVEFKNSALLRSDIGNSGKVAIIGNGMSALDFRPGRWGGATIGMNRTWELLQANYHCMIDVAQFRRVNSLNPLMRPNFKHLFVGIFWDLKYPWWNFPHWAWLRKLWLGKDYQSKYPLWRDWGFESCTEIATFSQTIVGGFSLEIHKYGAWLPSTTHMALQLAIHLGFHDIRIWGLDLKGPKFTAGAEITRETAVRQNTQFQLAAQTLKQLNVGRWKEDKPLIRIRNMSKNTACTAFEVGA